jgi:hypothetical protein
VPILRELGGELVDHAADRGLLCLGVRTKAVRSSGEVS